jgi:hypothetical protein
MFPKSGIIIGLIVMMGLALPAAADSQKPLSAEDMDRRLAFIEERLNAGRSSARLWQHGWSGFFAANTALHGYLAIRSDNADNEAAYTVGALKSAAGLAMMLLRPLPAVKGADPLQAMPAGTPEQKAARLQAAEKLLRANADRAEERTSWVRSLAAIAVHLVGSTAIAAIGDVRDAVESNMTGIAISAAHIWSQPYRAIDDLKAYETRFPVAPSSASPSWQLNAIPGGLCVTIRF